MFNHNKELGIFQMKANSNYNSQDKNIVNSLKLSGAGHLFYN